MYRNMFRFVITKHFQSQLKSYKKRFRFIKNDVIEAGREFNKDQANYLGDGVYKLRFQVTGLLRGKRNSFRLILLLLEVDNLLIPVCLYFKGEKSAMSKKEMAYHIRIVEQEMKEENILSKYS